MVDLDRSTALAAAFERALGAMLPRGWRATLTSRDSGSSPKRDADLVLTSPAGDETSACVEIKSRAEPSEVVRLVPWLRRCDAAILVAPAIGARARGILTEAGISWMEPDGDCRIAIGSLFIERLGRPKPRREANESGTRFVADLFSGAALRVVRRLLIDPDRAWNLAEMAWETGLTRGFVSRTFKTLARDAFIQRARGATRLSDRDALLAAWVAAPPPTTPIVERVALAGSAEAVLRAIGDASDLGRYAVTAEAAADRLAPFARFGRVEVYVEDAAAWDSALGLTAVPRGGNMVLLTKPDRGVFDGAEERDGLTLVSRPQLYVDLMRRGGAAAEAAAFLRERGELWPQQ
jgi:hypothetical protein